jgi:hypothetical protein
MLIGVFIPRKIALILGKKSLRPVTLGTGADKRVVVFEGKVGLRTASALNFFRLVNCDASGVGILYV